MIAMTEYDMFQLAARASYAYYEVYGTFPQRIGIHPSWHSILHHRIHFPIPTKIDPAVFFAEDFDPSTASKTRVHTAFFTLHYAAGADSDQVWLYHPDATDWIPSSLAFTLAGVTPTGIPLQEYYDDSTGAAQSHSLQPPRGADEAAQ